MFPAIARYITRPPNAFHAWLTEASFSRALPGKQSFVNYSLGDIKNILGICPMPGLLNFSILFIHSMGFYNIIYIFVLFNIGNCDPRVPAYSRSGPRDV